MTQKFLIEGGRPLIGSIDLSGAKNVALKALAATLLTSEEVIINNVPRIRDLSFMMEIVKRMGVEVSLTGSHQLRVKASDIRNAKVDLDMGVHLRTSSMVIAPLLHRVGQAIIPNPGGCRLGARPIDRHIDGLKKMGAKINYKHEDGYFYAKASKLTGTTYHFKKNTHTGTETLLLAAVLAQGKTVLENAASEPEVDDLIKLLKQMGAEITRPLPDTIIINGVKKLHGATHTIMPDRNEAITIAIAAYITHGDITIHGTQRMYLESFFDKLSQAKAKWQEVDHQTTRFYWDKALQATDIVTSTYPGFMTDWQAPWSVFMSQANGESTIHETIFEDRFGYVDELKKTGAKITFYNPPVKSPERFYNFNWSDNKSHYFHAIRIQGPTKLHNAILNIGDLRAGATLVLAALGAKGESVLHGVEILDRGYEDLDGRLNKLGGKIKRLSDKG